MRITETWLSRDSILQYYQLDGFTAFFNHKSVMYGGGTAIYVKNELHHRGLTDDVASNDSFNICAVTIDRSPCTSIVAVVYRSPWATLSDMKTLCSHLDAFVSNFCNIIIVGDFNLPGIRWDSSNGVKDSSMESIFRNFIKGQNLLQVAREATRKTALLDLLLTSRSCGQCDVTSLPPIAGSDHSAQLLRLKAVKRTNLEGKDRLVHHIRYENVDSITSSIDWPSTFSTCVTTNDYADRFTNILHDAIDMSSYFKPARKRKCLQKHIVKLLHSKRRAWLSAKRSGDFTSYKTLCQTVTSAIHQHTRCRDLRLVYSNDRKSFFKHLSSKLRSHWPHINITVILTMS